MFSYICNVLIKIIFMAFMAIRAAKGALFVWSECLASCYCCIHTFYLVKKPSYPERNIWVLHLASCDEFSGVRLSRCFEMFM